MSRHKRSHPPALLTIARRTLEQECGVAPGDHVLVAVSGGRDSMALLHVLAKLAASMGFSLAAHGVDHGLRAGASHELDLAEGFAARLGVPFARTQVHVERGSNLQERARLARYAALERALTAGGSKTRRLATAHHADDRAETVLLRMMRGASAAGLAVLPPRFGHKIRPFVRATREAIDAHVARHRVPFADDPSNEDPRYLRTRVRRELLPLLRELSPGIVAHLCGIADDVASLAPPVKGPHAERAALPRATRDALRSLESGKNPRARVALPGGRVARFDPIGKALVIGAAPARTAQPKQRKDEEA